MNTKVLIPALALLWGASACSKTPPPASSPVPAADRPPAAAPAAKKSVPADPIAADDVTRIPPGDVNQRVQQQQALLVCAYDSDEKFARVALAGALPRSAFSARMNKVPRDKQLIFYCS